MEGLIQDLKYAFRNLGQSKGLSVAVVLTLALGIGACTAIFSVVDGVLLRPLPYPDPDQVVQLWQVSKQSGEHMQTSDPNFEEWRDQSRSFEAMAQFGSGLTSVVGGVEPVRARVSAVSDGFFGIMGVQPQRGRTFIPEERAVGADPAAIVGHGFWQRLLESNPNLDDLSLSFSNRVHRVVGVMPTGFGFPRDAEIWIPREVFPRNQYRTAHNWLVVARLADGVSEARAQREMSEIGRAQLEANGEDIWLRDVDVVSLHEELVGDIRPRLMILLGAVGFLLLVACSNVVNLLLAQATSRRREIAVRAALGASRTRLARQFLAESVILVLASGLLGTLLADAGIQVLLSLEPGNLPRVDQVHLSWGVFGFTFGVCALVAIALGLVPVLHLIRRDLTDYLKDGARGQMGGATNRLRGTLVVAQVALTLVLLVGAGLMARSFLGLLDVHPGFRTSSAVSIELDMAFPSNEEDKRRLADFNAELLRQLKAIPGVEEAGGVNTFPLSGGGSNGRFQVENSEEDLGYAEFRVASEGYFPAMGIPLLSGRLPNPGDGPDAPHVAVISQKLADTKWPDGDAIGKRIQFGNMDGDRTLLNIVGIVGDVRDRGLDSETRGAVYLHYRQRPQRTAAFNVALYGKVPPEQIVGQAREVIRKLNPDLPFQFRTIEEVFSSSVADRRFSLLLLGVFGGAAVLLAGVGVFGVMAYAVSQRTSEIGLRMALGAVPAQVRRLVIRQGLFLVSIGTAVGLVAAFALSRLMAGLLFGISSHDPLTFLSTVVVLVVVALVASYLPAHRASRVNPLEALQPDRK